MKLTHVENRTNKRNPYLCKSGFYITEMNMGNVPGDGYKLISTEDIAGPFKNLQRAQQVYRRILHGNIQPHFGIRGPEHTDPSRFGGSHIASIWYPTQNKQI